MTIKWAVKYTENTDIGEYETRYVEDEDTGKRVLFDQRCDALASASEFDDCKDARLVRVNVRKKSAADEPVKSLGQVALEAFNASLADEPDYIWDEASFEEATAWNAAADAVIEAVLAGE